MKKNPAGLLRASDVGRKVTLAGFVHRVRDHGGLTFLDLRDSTGLVQVVFSPGTSAEAHSAAREVRPEWVVVVEGEVRKRPPGTENPALPTGDVEVAGESITVLSRALPPPFPLEDEPGVEEVTRLYHRYLDLRRERMQRNLWLRARVVSALRRQLEERGFLEVETPILTKSTPEGARDFLVPSRLQKGSFYALPQSPQLFKQVLMASGVERYYQVARCFRDEDLRADRQPEFTQLDMEMAFAEEAEVQQEVELALARAFRDVLGVDVEHPFPRLTYEEAMSRFSSDKPDLRYAEEIFDITQASLGEGVPRVLAGPAASGGVVRGLVVPAGFTRAEAESWGAEARGAGLGGVLPVWQEGGGIRSPAAAHMGEGFLMALRAASALGEGEGLVLVAGEETRVAAFLGGLRTRLAGAGRLRRLRDWAFCWVTGFPLLEWDEREGRYVSVHHPFTCPVPEDEEKLEKEPLAVRARSYDLVLNGVELGGGSVRIHRPDLQRRVFSLLGIGEEEAESRFGFLLRAFSHGVPPHAGIALGVDRLVMLMAGEENIRAVIAFPKTSSGQCPLTGAPSAVDEAQLREVGVSFRREA